MNKEKRLPKQHYALDSQNKLIHIRDVGENKDIYFCPNCKGEMIPKRGTIRDWHFAHKLTTENCSYETYLHSLAKLRICEWFNKTNNVTLYLDSKHVCPESDDCFWVKHVKGLQCYTITSKPRNLKKYYTVCEIEKQYGSYRADLFLSRKGEQDEPIFIEICVTHPCSEDKINSGIRIIEFKVRSEEDIDYIIKHPIQKSEKVAIYNFKNKPDKQYGEQKIKLHKFVIGKFHKISTEIVGCRDAKLYRKGIFEMTIRQDDLQKMDNLRELGVIAAIKDGIEVRYCELCKWQDDDSKVVACKQYKKVWMNKFTDANGERAWRCADYDLDGDIYRCICERLKDISHDIWKPDC